MARRLISDWLKPLLIYGYIYMVASWLACLLAGWLVSLLACMLPYLLVGWLGWLACLTCLLACLPAGFIVKGWSEKKTGEGREKKLPGKLVHLMYTNPQMAVVYDIGFTTLIFPSPFLPNYLIQWIRHAPKARPQIALVPREEVCQPAGICGCCFNRAWQWKNHGGFVGKCAFMHFLIELCGISIYRWIY